MTAGDRDGPASGSPVPPTRDDRLVAALSEGVGGPLGDRAGRHPWWTPVRVVLALTALCFALGMVQKAPCYEDSWQDGDARYTHMCYSDLPYLYTGRGFVELNWPYSDDVDVRRRYDVMEYPVVISYYAWATAWVTHWVSGSPDLSPRFAQRAEALFSTDSVAKEVRLYVVVNALGFAAAALLAAWFLARTHPHRPWDAALFALSPALALNALVNWDLLVVVLVAGATWAWARGRPGLTGALIGLGTATKLFPLLLLGAVLVICLRRRDPVRFAVTLGAALVAWAVANLPAYLTGPSEWAVFWDFNADRGADLGSLWLVLEQALSVTVDTDTINVVSWAFLAVWCLGVLALGLGAPETPRLAQLGLLVVVGFLLVNKVYSPQYVLWLLPLAVLARPRWRDLLVWQAGEVFYFASVWWYLGGHLEAPGGGESGAYWVAIALRMLAEIYLAAVVTRDVLRPAHDPVRRPVTDPADQRAGSRRQSSRTRSNQVAV